MLAPRVVKATVTVLERLGHRVEVPSGQTCCGQMHFNSGYQPECVPMVRRFVSLFSGYDAVVAPSGSCVAMIRHHHVMVADRAPGAERASLRAALAELVPRVRELSELLVDDLGVTDVGASFPHRVTYHPTCHSLRMLGIDRQPRALLGAVRDIELVALEDATTCCGFGGTFALKNAETSTSMLADKASRVLATGAEVLCAADTSCLMHIGGGLDRLKAGVRTMHLAEVLAAQEGAPGWRRRP